MAPVASTTDVCAYRATHGAASVRFVQVAPAVHARLQRFISIYLYVCICIYMCICVYIHIYMSVQFVQVAPAAHERRSHRTANTWPRPSYQYRTPPRCHENARSVPLEYPSTP
jgi:hypothetical protein